MATTARAHPNIALIKYWGKAPGGGNIPAVPSMSITLDGLHSTTTVEDASRDTVRLNGAAVDNPKINGCLDNLRSRHRVPHLQITTDNNFPTSAGLASSASGFAALVTAIDAHCELKLSVDQRADFARQASGSAGRSIHGGFVGLNGPDWIARPLYSAGYWSLKVVIAITDHTAKNVSSSSGMNLSAETSPYYPAWLTTTADDYERVKDILAARDFGALAELSEWSCLKMHGVMSTSQPPMIYWKPATVACIEAVRSMRAEGTDVFFTIDAGPQVKAVCTPDHAQKVHEVLGAIPGVLSTRTVGLGQGATVIARSR